MSAGRKNNSTTKHWNTPPKIIFAAKKLFGRIDLDPCSNEFSLVNAGTKYVLPQNDGLKDDWFGNVFCNPPYGRNPSNKTSLLDWVNKAIETFSRRKNQILLLIPVATNTKHFYKIWETSAAICFLKDSRLKFWINGKEDPKGAPMACCVVYWGLDKEGFKEAFEDLGKVVLP